MFSLKEFEQNPSLVIDSRTIRGGDRESGRTTIQGNTYECDWVTANETRCYNSDGSIDVYVIS